MMKTQWLLGLALSAACLGAQAQQDQERVTIPAPRLTIELPARTYFMDRLEFSQFRGSYTLADGSTLRLRGNDYAMYGEIDNQGEHRLVAANDHTFVALDRKLKVRIDRADNGEVGGEVLMAVPMRLAASGEIEEVVVSLATR